MRGIYLAKLVLCFARSRDLRLNECAHASALSDSDINYYVACQPMASWDDMFRAGHFRLEEPQEQVVKIVSALRENNVIRVCDLGCGPGRNLIFLADQGFEVYGVDISETALEMTRQKAAKLGLKVNLMKGDMTSLLFPDLFFDAVICVYVIYHGTLYSIKRTLLEIRRVLRPGGFVLVTFQTRRSHKYGSGKEIEPNTFVQQEPPELGIIHHFSDETEVRLLMEQFQILNVELEELSTKNGNQHSHWQVLARKSQTGRGL